MNSVVKDYVGQGDDIMDLVLSIRLYHQKGCYQIQPKEKMEATAMALLKVMSNVRFPTLCPI